MSLITQYGADNLIIDTALVVTYSKTLVSGSWGYTSANTSGYYNYMWELHRRARQSFRYVGMTQEAAFACRDAMIAKYTRNFYLSLWNGDTMGGAWVDNPAGSQIMAEVSPAHNDDGSYDVIVNVMEDDMRMRKTNALIDLAAVFYVERQRTYEGGETETSNSNSNS